MKKTLVNVMIISVSEIEDKLSEALISGQVQLGDAVTIGASKGNITLTVKDSKTQPLELVGSGK